MELEAAMEKKLALGQIEQGRRVGAIKTDLLVGMYDC
jgi:hypothetical protein